jgi:hypothetical protein
MKRVLVRCQLVCILAVTIFSAQNVVAQEQSDGVRECSNATLHGSFGYTSTGTLLETFVPPPFAGPFAEVGRQTFDGKGNTEAIVTFSANGNISSKVTFEGTYKVNPDCTGSMTLSNPSLGAIHADFVIDDEGKELRTISTDSGVVESRVYKKQFRGGRTEH